MGARWYSEKLGRWISADPIIPDPANPQSLNRYSYVYNRPLVYVDRDGHFPWPVVILLAALLTLPGDTGPYGVQNPFSQIWSDWGPFSRSGVYDAALRAPKPTSQNMTGWLIDQMKTNAQAPVTQEIRKHWQSGNPAHKAAAYQAWVALVRGDAVWDFKADIPKEFKESGVTLGDFRMDFDAVANIHFGFVGRAAGFNGEFLKFGAGIAQWNQWKDTNPSNIGPWHTYLDDPFDYWCVDFGIFLHDLHGGDPDKMTPEAFNQALWDYIGMYGLPSRGVYPEKEP